MIASLLSNIKDKVDDYIDNNKPISLNNNQIKSIRYLQNDQELKQNEVDQTEDIEGITEVTSSAVEHISYDPRKKITYVKFRNGDKTYAYPNVDKKAFEQLGNAASKGAYMNYVFGPKYSKKGFRAKEPKRLK